MKGVISYPLAPVDFHVDQMCTCDLELSVTPDKQGNPA